MKWFLVGSLCLCCSTTGLRADPAFDLDNKASSELAAAQYPEAAADFDKLIASNPTYSGINQVRVKAGLAYIYAAKYAEAIDRLQKVSGEDAKPEIRGDSLYFLLIAQFSAGQKDKDAKMYGAAATTATTLIDFIAKHPTSANQAHLEQTLFYRSLAFYEMAKYPEAEADLTRLTSEPQFAGSLSRPDYLLRLASAYAVETNAAVTAKQTKEVVTAKADKAIDAYNLVSKDPNALVQANEANLQIAQLEFLLAQLDSSGNGYQKALDAFRRIRRKDDMIPLQQRNLDELRRKAQIQAQQSAQSGGKIPLDNDLPLLIEREQARLEALKKDTDPIIQALIRIAECYVSLKQSDEARTVLHRLANVSLAPDQQQEVDFQTLYSYVLGGQTVAADKALTAYLAKHKGDTQADSISFSIAAELAKRQDYAGALKQAQRSMTDFPNGTYAPNALALEAEMLNKLGRRDEADQVVADFLKANPTSPVANQLYLTKAASDTSKGDLTAALADYKLVRDNASAGPEIQSAAWTGYILTLNSLKMYDDVIKEAKDYQAKFPNGKQLPSVLLFSARALDQKHDPGAVAAFQDIPRKFPKSDVSPFALFSVVKIYQAANNLTLLQQSAKDLQSAYPDAYPLLVQTAEIVSAALIKTNKFTDALAVYQPLARLEGHPDIAALAQNKIGDVSLAYAKSFHYQSLPADKRPEAEQKLAAAEEAYLTTLKKFSDQLATTGDAFTGLTNCIKQRGSWGLLKESDYDTYLGKLGAGLTDPTMMARFEMAQASLVFLTRNGAKDYPAALERFKKVVAANPDLKLTRQESDHFGELLLAAKDYGTAQKVYSDLLSNAGPNDNAAQASADYGLGAIAMAQGDLPKAKDYFLKLKALPGGGAWHPHITDANYGLALANEASSDPADREAAKQLFGQLLQAQGASSTVRANATLHYGQMLEQSGNALKPTATGANEFAVHYYLQPSLFLGTATPEESAQGLYLAGQVYDKAGDKVNAKKQYDALLKTYKDLAPNWAAKALTAGGQ